ncbi:heavy-metal-associated domain-containing protein [Poriferisphaera sp. WC338]|uniref:heavy-metal-associated domain-containing protein n=1 Tax=Poriferisphaera sp. WC338 TaxID=3425129 RepID=UPI003D817FBD
MSTIVIKIDGMMCEGCAGTVQASLSKVRGVRTAVVDLAAKEANVQVEDGKVTQSELVEAVRGAGYEAVPA